MTNLLSNLETNLDQPTIAPTQPGQAEPNSSALIPAAPSALSDRQLASGKIKSTPAAGMAQGLVLGKIVIVLVVILILINVPLNRLGHGLTNLTSQATPVMIYEGGLLQAEGSPVYVVENYQLRPFSSAETFARFKNRYSLPAPQLAPAEALAGFSQGRPIHWLIQCANSPEIYSLENGQKHLALYPPTEQGRWDELHRVSCQSLADLPEGLPLAETEQNLD